MKKNCLIGIIGRDEFYKTWFAEPSNYDVILIIYNDLVIPQKFKDKCKLIIYRPGLSGALVQWLFRDIVNIDDYKYYWLPNEDVTINPNDINLLFMAMEANCLTQAMPSLERDEHPHAWAGIVDNQGAGIRDTLFIEGICGCYESSFFKRNLEYLTFNQSAMGIDVLLSKHCHDEGLRIAIIDDIIAKHNGPQGCGSMSKYLRDNNINCREDYGAILRHFKLQPYFDEIVKEDRAGRKKHG
jgi:hypothetical protein